MSTVLLQKFGGGGTQPVTSFADSFNRTDQPFYLGNLWLPVFASQAGGGIVASNLAAAVNVAGSAANFSTATNLNRSDAAFIPYPVDWPVVDKISSAPGRGQFAQFTVTTWTVGGNPSKPGLICYGNMNLGVCYFAAVEPTQHLSVRNSVDLDSATIIGSLLSPISMGDTVRMEVRTDGVLNNTIILKVNGTVVQTVTDPITDVVPGGVFGIGWYGANNASTSVTNFSAGIL